ncbi:MAG: nucleoside diphosphate kinase regulator [Pyrinomonadaceae bacterium]
MIDTTTIYITKTDLERLEHLIKLVRSKGEKANFPYINALEEKLEYADTAASEDIPSNIVTMRSKVRLNDLKTGKDTTYTLVFPSEADIDEGKISILAPLATAILGHRLGDEVEFKSPSGLRRLAIDEIIYQPESTGEYHL